MSDIKTRAIDLPYLVNIAGSIRSPKDVPIAARGRIIRVSTYCQFAAAMGHNFTTATVYNRCKSKTIQHTKVDGIYFVLLEKKAYDDHYLPWSEARFQYQIVCDADNVAFTEAGFKEWFETYVPN